MQLIFLTLLALNVNLNTYSNYETSAQLTSQIQSAAYFEDKLVINVV